MSECKEKCKQELEELQKHQNERVQLLLQEQEEREQKMKLENQKKRQGLRQNRREFGRERKYF